MIDCGLRATRALQPTRDLGDEGTGYMSLSAIIVKDLVGGTNDGNGAPLMFTNDPPSMKDAFG